MKNFQRAMTIFLLLLAGLLSYMIAYNGEMQLQQLLNQKLALQGQSLESEPHYRFYEIAQQISDIELKIEIYRPFKFLGILLMDMAFILALSEIAVYCYTKLNFTSMGDMLKGKNNVLSAQERTASMPVLAAIFVSVTIVVVALTVVWQLQY